MTVDTAPERVQLADLENAAHSVLTEQVDFSTVDLRDALDARRALERRQVTGGPAPNLVRETIVAGREQLNADKAAYALTTVRLSQASRELREQVQRYGAR